jgi:serpin B
MIRRSLISTMAALLLATMLCPAKDAAGIPPMRAQDVQRLKVQEAAQGEVAFTADLYAQLRRKEGNLFFSPYSISTALTMTWAGAAGETAAEMEKALRLPIGPGQKIGGLSTAITGGEIPAIFRDLQKMVSDSQKGDCVIANALWGQEGFDFRKDYVSLVKDNFGGEMSLLNFGEEPKARATINDWVAKQTHDKIKDLIGKGVLGRGTRLVLTNAIYFKAPWEVAFDPKATKKGDFYLAAEKVSNMALADGKAGSVGRNDEIIQVDMMHRMGEMMYLKEEGVSVLEIPYKGARAAMMIFLPETRDGLAELEKGLTFEKIDSWRRNVTRTKVIATLPKFKMTGEFRLDATLQAMGMKLAFGNADFSGMSEKEKLSIAAVVHKAFVEVNEEGTEAAGATGVVVARASIARDEPKPVTFTADHPFLFVIRDNQTGSILFMGRVADPR